AELGGVRALRPAIVVHNLIPVLARIGARIGLRRAHRGTRHRDVGRARRGPQLARARIGEAILEPAETQFVHRVRSHHRSPGSLAVAGFHRRVAVVAQGRAAGQHRLRLNPVRRTPVHHVHIERHRDAAGNQVGTFSTQLFPYATRPDTRYGSILQVENGAQSWYNALAVQFQKRMAKGFTAQVNYTWSHAIDDG